jgi:Zn-dependent protease
LVLFACVLVHELAHSVTANRLGLDIKEITLFIFGGVAKMSGEPENPRTEFLVAIAGPLASLALAALFWTLEWAVASVYYAPPLVEVLSFLGTINFVLLVFNLIPGFPLDGGRVLRAAWWWKTGDIKGATLAASRVGRGFAWFLILTGVFQLLQGSVTGGLWSVLIGVFLRQAAIGSYRQLLLKLNLDGIRVGDVMERVVITTRSGATLAEAVQRCFIPYRFSSLPVVDGDGAVVGMLEAGDVKRVGEERWGATPVEEVMIGLPTEAVLAPVDTMMDAYTKMSSTGLWSLPVIEGGRLVGIVTKRHVAEAVESARSTGSGGAGGSAGEGGSGGALT